MTLSLVVYVPSVASQRLDWSLSKRWNQHEHYCSSGQFTVRPQMLVNGEKTFVKWMLHHIPFTQHSLPQSYIWHSKWKLQTVLAIYVNCHKHGPDFYTAIISIYTALCCQIKTETTDQYFAKGWRKKKQTWTNWANTDVRLQPGCPSLLSKRWPESPFHIGLPVDTVTMWRAYRQRGGQWCRNTRPALH